MVLDKDINMQLEEISELLLNEKEIRQLILNLVRNGWESDYQNLHGRQRCGFISAGSR
ncbi:MAG: hypothetical protein A4E55_02073 [Pelotomaculum sp. PtaU1.Bin035]|nr:MAG: hypothetical protein A4E55_02073 [Pelotomaculum sp. PtaU1.Bin035]